MNTEIYNTANSDLLPSNVNVIVIYRNTCIVNMCLPCRKLIRVDVE